MWSEVHDTLVDSLRDGPTRWPSCIDPLEAEVAAGTLDRQPPPPDALLEAFRA